MEPETLNTNKEQARGCEASELSGLVMRIRRYNEWRRGADFEQPEPIEVGSDIDTAVEILETLRLWHEQLSDRACRDGNAPGHGHSEHGVWDSDNGDIAGHVCAECALWNIAKELSA